MDKTMSLRCAVAGAGDRDAILHLRLRAHQAEGRMLELAAADLESPLDVDATHLICVDGQRIVGYLRSIAVRGGRVAEGRSAYAGYGLVIPRFLWTAGFVEGGGGSVDPEYQRVGVLAMLIAEGVRRACAAGFRHVVGGARDDLRTSYLNLGFTEIDRRRVTPVAGWTFDATLLHLDLDAALTGRLAGRHADAMTAAARAGVSKAR